MSVWGFSPWSIIPWSAFGLGAIPPLPVLNLSGVLVDDSALRGIIKDL